MFRGKFSYRGFYSLFYLKHALPTIPSLVCQTCMFPFLSLYSFLATNAHIFNLKTTEFNLCNKIRKFTIKRSDFIRRLLYIWKKTQIYFIRNKICMYVRKRLTSIWDFYFINKKIYKIRCVLTLFVFMHSKNGLFLL